MKSLLFVSVLIIFIAVSQTTSTQLSASAFDMAPALGEHLFALTLLGIFNQLLFLPLNWLCRPRRGDEHAVSSASSASSASSEETALTDAAPAPSSASPSLLYSAVGEENAQVQVAVTAPPPPPSLGQRVARLCALYALFLLANLFYVFAIAAGLAPSLVAAVFASCPVFVLLFSLLVERIQKQREQKQEQPFVSALNSLHVVAVAAAVIGVVLALQPWESVEGDFLAGGGSHGAASDGGSRQRRMKLALAASIVSPVLAAIYKVLFSLWFTERTAGEDAHWTASAKVLGQLGAVNVICAPILLFGLIYPLSLEPPFWAPSEACGAPSSPLFNDSTTTVAAAATTSAAALANISALALPRNCSAGAASLATVSDAAWALHFSSSATGLLFNLLLNFAVTVAPPVHISVGTVLSTVLSTVFDVAFRGLKLGWLQGVGIAVVAVSLVAIAKAAEKQKEDAQQRRLAEQEQ